MYTVCLFFNNRLKRFKRFFYTLEIIPPAIAGQFVFWGLKWPQIVPDPAPKNTDIHNFADSHCICCFLGGAMDMNRLKTVAELQIITDITDIFIWIWTALILIYLRKKQTIMITVKREGYLILLILFRCKF